MVLVALWVGLKAAAWAVRVGPSLCECGECRWWDRVLLMLVLMLVLMLGRVGAAALQYGTVPWHVTCGCGSLRVIVWRKGQLLPCMCLAPAQDSPRLMVLCCLLVWMLDFWQQHRRWEPMPQGRKAVTG